MGATDWFVDQSELSRKSKFYAIEKVLNGRHLNWALTPARGVPNVTELFSKCKEKQSPGRVMCRRLKPARDFYFCLPRTEVLGLAVPSRSAGLACRRARPIHDKQSQNVGRGLQTTKPGKVSPEGETNVSPGRKPWVAAEKSLSPFRDGIRSFPHVRRSGVAAWAAGLGNRARRARRSMS